jgi:hypothetical protein
MIIMTTSYVRAVLGTSPCSDRQETYPVRGLQHEAVQVRRFSRTSLLCPWRRGLAPSM